MTRRSVLSWCEGPAFRHRHPSLRPCRIKPYSGGGLADQIGQCEGVASPRNDPPTKAPRHVADCSPRPRVLGPSPPVRPKTQAHRFQTDNPGKPDKMPSRQMFLKVKEFAMPCDHPHLGRKRPILQGT